MRRAVWLTLMLLVGAGRVLAVDITTCGVTVPSGATGVLQADLNCTGGPVPAVRLEAGASLEMNSHGVYGGAVGVACARGCTIKGPGTISGCSAYGVDAWNTERGTIRISGVVISGCGHGIADFECAHRVVAIDLTITDSAQYGMYAGSIRATNTDIDDNLGWGVWACTRFVGTNVTADNNEGAGIAAGTSIRGKTIHANDNQGAGLTAGSSIRVDTLIAQGNKTNPGVVSRGFARLANSVVTGNRFAGDPLDVLSLNRPRIRASTCGRSGRLILDGNGFVVGESWGECGDD